MTDVARPAHRAPQYRRPGCVKASRPTPIPTPSFRAATPGAELAAARLLEIEPWKSATAIKVNPDSPQRPLRAEALRRGITVFVPTPRLRGGFKKLDPRRIPPEKIQEAAGLSHGDRWSEEVALSDMPGLDAIVCGSVAVTRDGRRCGKGEGYSDLEFAILRELGHPPVAVATTVHDLHIVDSVPRDPTDQPLSVIATPTHAIPHQAPQRRTDGYRLEAPQRRGPSGNADSGRTQENDNIERLKRPVTLMEDLDFVTRLERSGQQMRLSRLGNR